MYYYLYIKSYNDEKTLIQLCFGFAVKVYFKDLIEKHATLSFDEM